MKDTIKSEKINASLLIADENFSIKYRPQFSRELKSVTAAILLQQINFRWRVNRGRPFYKFKLPCQHKAYRQGDSWSEELGFSRKEFDTALSKISLTPEQKKKIRQGVAIKKTKWQSLVEYFIDTNRMTWYSLNEDRFNDLCTELYVTTEKGFRKRPKVTLPETTESDFTYKETENTTEITTEKKTLGNEKGFVAETPFD